MRKPAEAAAHVLNTVGPLMGDRFVGLVDKVIKELEELIADTEDESVLIAAETSLKAFKEVKENMP